MRVQLITDGGFAYMPGLASPVVVDSAHLSAEEAVQLQRLCEAASATGQQQATSNATPVPDGRRYRLTIETADSRRELSAADPIDHPAVARLIAFVQQRGRRRT
jgi:hypothetical protein